MQYKFRLVFYHARPGFFRIDEESVEYELADNITIQVVPRDTEKLITACKYHIESRGYSSAAEADEIGKKLRTHFRMLNCMLDLGLSIPINDGSSGRVSDQIKEDAREKGGEILDTIVGLRVFPDDESHFEHVTSGKMNVFSSDPYYVLKGLKDSWPSDFKLDESTSEVIEILNISVKEASPKVKFLATYLAMEQIIQRKMRSEKAQELIDKFVELTNSSELTKGEKDSLAGSLGYLKEQSFSSAFSGFAKRVQEPESINGMPVTKFVSECIKLRNKIAHNVAIKSMPKIEEYSKYLRNMALSLLWTENKFPNISVYRPADTIEVEKMEIRVL
jgi:hypothetical protein